MDYDERYQMNEEARIASSDLVCHTGCNNAPHPEDPIVIDGHIYCDLCASDIMKARLPKIMAALTEPYMRQMDAALAEMICPIRSVKHI